ncbi:MAG: hypothetical protein AB8H80_00880 [Planctomycetota bacterium]
MKTGPLSILVLLAMLAAAWWLWQPREARVPAAPTVTTGGSSAAPNAGDRTVDSRSDRIAATSTERPSPAPASSWTAPIAPIPPLPNEARWIEVLIVDATTQKPVANAEVRFSSEAQKRLLAGKSAALRRDFAGDPAALTESIGWTARSDKRGIARIAVEAFHVHVLASKNGKSGEGSFSLPATLNAPYIVQLEPDVEFAVLVRNADGAPAIDIPVHLLACDRSTPRTTPWWNPRARRTDAAGRVTFRHGRRARRTPFGKLVGHWQFTAGLPTGADGTYGRESVRVAADPKTGQPMAEQPITITLPATGELDLQLLMHGVPLSHSVDLELRIASQDGVDSIQQPFLPCTFDATGSMRFPHAPLDRQFTLGGNHWQKRFDGPKNPNEVARISIELAELAVSLTGRLLDANGEPAANARFEGTGSFAKQEFGKEGEQWTEPLDFRTDEQGRFVGLLCPHPQQASLKLRALQLEQRGDPELPTATLSLPAAWNDHPLSPGSNELGDLPLARAPFLCSGRLDLRAPPPADTYILVFDFHSSTQAGDPEWRRTSGVQQIVRKDGTFDIYGFGAPGRYRARAFGRRLLETDPVEFAYGDRDVILPAALGTIVSVTAKTPAATRFEHFEVHYQLRDKETDEPSQMRRASSEPGTLRWHAPSVAPGNYRLQLTTKTGLHIKRVFEVTDNDKQHLDLGTIDLTEHVQALIVQLEVELSQPGQLHRNRSIAALCLPHEASAETETDVLSKLRLERGRNVLPLLRRRAHDLLIVAPGYLPVPLPAASKTVTARLRPSPTASLTLTEHIKLPADVQLVAEATATMPADAYRRRFVEAAIQAQIDDSTQKLLTGSTTRASFEQGKAKLQLGAGPHALALFLERDGERLSLQSFEPRHLRATGDHYNIVVSATEIAERLQ